MQRLAAGVQYLAGSRLISFAGILGSPLPALKNATLENLVSRHKKCHFISVESRSEPVDLLSVRELSDLSQTVLSRTADRESIMSNESCTYPVEGEELLHQFAERLAIRACCSKSIPVALLTQNRSPCVSSGSISIPDSDAPLKCTSIVKCRIGRRRRLTADTFIADRSETKPDSQALTP